MSPPSRSGSPTRRELLETALGSSVIGLAGCLSLRGSGGENTDGPTETEPPPSPDPNASPTPNPSPTPDQSAPGSDRRHDFWISNRTGTEYAIDVTVTRTDSNVSVLDGCYESPGGLAIRFRDVGEEDVTYDVRARFVGGSSGDGDSGDGGSGDSGETLEDQWVPGACPEAYADLYGTDGGVVIENGTMSFTQNECDYATVGDELPALPAADVEPCSERTSAAQSVTTISPSRISTG